MRAIVLFRRAAPSIDICGVGHFPLHDGDHAVVNVNNIYIPKPSRLFVKRAPRRSPWIIFGSPMVRRAEPAADHTVLRLPALCPPAGDRAGRRDRADSVALSPPAD